MTSKISVSLNKSDLASLQKRAKRLYAGNVSAVIAEFASDAARLEAMHELVGWLGGPVLTEKDREAIDGEWSGEPESKRRSPRKRTA